MMNQPIPGIDLVDTSVYARSELATRYQSALIVAYHLHAEAKEHFVLAYAYIIQQLQRGLDMCKSPYNPDNHDMVWDNKNIVIDRDPGSLSGSLTEISLFLSDYPPDGGGWYPYLSKYDQVDRGLDFRYADGDHQVKGGIVSLSGRGDIEVTESLFEGEADHFHIFTRYGGKVIEYRGSKSQWQAVIEQEKRRYDGEKLPRGLVLEVVKMNRAGIAAHTSFDWAIA